MRFKVLNKFRMIDADKKKLVVLVALVIRHKVFWQIFL